MKIIKFYHFEIFQIQIFVYHQAKMNEIPLKLLR